MARLFVNNPIKSVARFQSGMSLEKAFDPSLKTMRSFTAAAALQAFCVYGSREGMTAYFSHHLSKENASRVSDGASGAVGVLVSHPFFVAYLSATPKSGAYEQFMTIYRKNPARFAQGGVMRLVSGVIECGAFFQIRDRYAPQWGEEKARLVAATSATMLSIPAYQVALNQIVGKGAEMRLSGRHAAAFLGLSLLASGERFLVDFFQKHIRRDFK